MYQDETEAFWEACSGNVVKQDGFPLHRLMNALEVMDPNMDGGMPYPLELIARDDRTPYTAHSLIVSDSLSVQELCFVLDRMLACELEWMRGASLGQTLYTCVYYHDYVMLGIKPSAHWSHEVLHMCLLAMAKTCALQWHELMRQNVVDAEDFSGDTGGVALSDGVVVSDIVERLDAALQEVELVAPLDAPSVAARIAKCKSITAMSVGEHILQLQEAALSTAPLRMQAYFDVTLSRKFSSSIPLRPLPLPSAKRVLQGWLSVLTNDMGLVLAVLSDDSVLLWITLLQEAALTFHAQHPISFARSLLQTCMNNGVTVAGVTRDLEHLAASAVEELTQVSMQNVLARLEWHDAHEPSNAIGRKTLEFVRRMSGMIAQMLFVFAQNRGRQKRRFAKAYSVWADLVDDGTRLGTAVEAAIGAQEFPADTFQYVAQFFLVLQMVHAVGAGFDLDLYAEKERGCMYWILAQLYGEQEALCVRLLFLTKFPLCPDAEAQAESTFARRLKFLKRPAWCAPPKLHTVTGVKDDKYLFSTLWLEWKRYAAIPLLLAECQTWLEHSADTFATARMLQPRDPWTALCADKCIAQDAAVEQVCQATRAFLDQYPTDGRTMQWNASNAPWFWIPSLS
ncbi:hypothetical protein MVES_000669 [Malassezia vespertilionis]|uniref:Mak10p n=1 Tax=Malassezia vespertilionis TaxID=2020962 RepID=A0A2N1JG95_9BASI|nr:hypothetical protein MVES_000669 [Malassezia vespertilionis]